MRPQLFVPLSMSPRTMQQNHLRDRDLEWLFIKGRLTPGAGLDQAQADIGALSHGLQKSHAIPNRKQRLRVETELEMHMAQGPEITQMVVIAGGSQHRGIKRGL